MLFQLVSTPVTKACSQWSIVANGKGQAYP
jgi:hypothetical protein